MVMVREMFPLVSEDSNNMFEGDTFGEGIHWTGICLVILSAFLVSFTNFKQRQSSWWLQPEKYDIVRFDHFHVFLAGDLKKKHPKSKQPSKKRIGKIIPKKINQATLTVNQKSSTTKRQKTANPSTSHHEDLAWCLCDFSHCWIKTFATHIIADTTRPHVHLNKRPWRRFHLFEIGWKSARRKGFGVYHKDISSLEFHQ